MRSILLTLALIVLSSSFLLAQTNLALTATPSASASSSGSYGPSNWNDNLIGPNYNFGWLGTDPTSFATPAWLQYQWSSAQTLNKVRFYNPTHINGNFVIFYGTADLQYDSAGTWVTATQVTGQGSVYYDISFTPVTTTKIRMTNFVISGLHNPGWDEIEVYYDPPQVIDMGVVSVISEDTLTTSDSLDVEAQVVNFGNTLISGFSINLAVNDSVREGIGYTAISINPGDTFLVAFTVPVYIKPGINEICVYTELMNDADPGNDTLCKTIVNIPASITEPAVDLSLQVYPQPASDELVVEGDFQDATLLLFDMQGSLVARTEHCRQRAELDVSHLSAGSYILSVTEGARRSSVPVVIR